MTSRPRAGAEQTARIPAQRTPPDPWHQAMEAGKRAGQVADAAPDSRAEIAVAAALLVYSDHVAAKYRHRFELLVSDHNQRWAAVGCSCGFVGHQRRGAWTPHQLVADWTDHLNTQRKA